MYITRLQGLYKFTCCVRCTNVVDFITNISWCRLVCCFRNVRFCRFALQMSTDHLPSTSFSFWLSFVDRKGNIDSPNNMLQEKENNNSVQTNKFIKLSLKFEILYSI